MEVKTLLEKLQYKPLERQEKAIKLWEEYYQGKVTGFHEYFEYMGSERVKRDRKTLKMAKAIAEVWADNIINPETRIVLENNQDWWDTVDDNLGVTPNLNDLMELTFALSNGATVQSKDAQGNVFQQYIPMSMIYPLEARYGEIVSCAFASERGDKSIYLQVHQYQNGKYKISNLFYDEDGKPITEEGIEETFESDVKLFQIYKPAIVNNVTLGSPLGISIYANAIDELKSVDIAYDALDKEIRNGRMRIFVHGDLLYRDKGREKMIFDKDQDEFYLLPELEGEDAGSVLIKVEAPTLRVNDLIDNLEKQLNLLGSKCGLGDNAFYSEGGTIYTNTSQVVSSNSKFYKTRRKHTTRIEKSLVEMVKAMYFLEFGKEIDDVIHVEFDDSIIHDKDEEYNRSRMEVMQGLKSHIQHFMDTQGINEEQAKGYWAKQMEFMALQPDVEEEGGEV